MQIRKLWKELRSWASGSTPVSNWLDGLRWGQDTTSGIRVDEDTALNFSAVFCAVTVLSDSLKILPISVYRHRADGGRDPAPASPVHRLLHLRPNPRTTPARFISYMQACKLLWGNGYAQIDQDGKGRPTALWPIHPSRVVVGVVDGVPHYEITPEDDGEKYTIDQSQMFHVYDLSNNGYTGVSRIGAARESLGLGLAAETFGSSFFGQGARPGGVLEHPGNPSDEATKNLRTSWERLHKGADNAGKIAILREGIKYQAIGIPPEDAQFLETRQFQVVEVARWFNITPHKLKDLTHATFSNVEHLGIEFVTESILPHTVDFEQEADFKLFPTQEHGVYFAKFNLNALLRGDAETRAKYYETMRRNGVYSVNEIRRLEDMNPVGDEGDVRIVELNMQPLESLVSDPDAPKEPVPSLPPLADEQKAAQIAGNGPVGPFQAAKPIISDVASRLIRRESDRIRRICKRHASEPDQIRERIESFYDDHAAAAKEAIGPVMAFLDVYQNGNGDLRSLADTWVAQSRGQLLGLIRDNIPTTTHAAITQRLDEWIADRPGEFIKQVEGICHASDGDE